MITFVVAAIAGLVLGLQAALSPGPLMAVILGESLKGGRKHGIRYAMIPLWTDPVVILIALLVVAQLSERILALISVVGAILLIRYGVVGLRAEKHPPLCPQERENFLTAVGLNFANPNLLIFAFTVHSINLIRFWHGGWEAAVGYLFFFFLSLIGVNMLIAVIAGSLQARIPEPILLHVGRFLGYFLLGTAALFIVRAFLFLC